MGFDDGGGGGSSTSSSSATTTTQITDSYNQTRYDTSNLSDIGNLSLASGATHASGSILASGAQQAGGSIETSNVSIGGGSIGTSASGGGILDSLRPYMLYILIGLGVILAIKFFRRQ